MQMLSRYLAAAAGAALALLATGCLADDRRGQTDAELFAEALEFGAVVLPPSGEVLGADKRTGRETTWRLVVAVDPAELDELLDASGFEGELDEQRPNGNEPLPGFSVADASVFATGHELALPTEARPQQVGRHVLVDRSDWERTLVHWWVFTL